MNAKLTLSEMQRMVNEARANIEQGVPADVAISNAGFTDMAQYSEAAKRLGVSSDTAEKPDWVGDYAPTQAVHTSEKKLPAQHVAPQSLPNPASLFEIVVQQMKLVQEMSRTCTEVNELATLTDLIVRLSEQAIS